MDELVGRERGRAADLGVASRYGHADCRNTAGSRILIRVRLGIILLFVVSLLAGNLLAVGHAHALPDGSTSVEFHPDSSRDSGDTGHGTHGHCDVCGHTCCQPGAVTSRSGVEPVRRAVPALAPSCTVVQRLIPVPIEPPRTSLRR